MAIETSVVLNDSTLRDGEQTPGVAFTCEEKIAIAQALDELGIDEIEAGVPAMGSQAIAEIRDIAASLKRAQPIAWCRMTRADVDAAKKTGIGAVNLSIPVSDIQIEAKLRAGRNEILKRIQDVIPYALDCGMRVAVGGEDSSRADRGFLCTIVQHAVRAGARRFRYADTLGILDPFAASEVFMRLRQETDCELEFHGHNDLGLATANTLAAIRGGATHASVCVLGIGERAGNAALEEVAAGIERLELGTSRVRLEKLQALAQLVSEAARRPIPMGKAIVGASVFTHESGIHVDGLLKNPHTYEALPPHRFGRKRQIVLGRHSGTASVARALRDAGLSAEGRRVEAVLAGVRQRALETKHWISPEDLLDLYRQSEQNLH